MVTRDWKYIEFLDGGGPEFYSLKDDIAESKNLLAADAERAAQLQADLQQWQQSVGAKMPEPNPDYDPERADEWWNPWSNEKIDREFLRRVFKVGIPE